MSNSYFRMTRVEAGEGTADTGAFSMVSATEGEASDGDILSIKGGSIPAEMTMFPNHDADPQKALGVITNPRKKLRESPAVLLNQGQILMDGEGADADIRRDIALKLSRGVIKAVSIRWDADPGDVTPRVNLPADHLHFVDASKPNLGPKRFGNFFHKWRAMEVSVVGLGADQSALIDAARSSVGAVSEFWARMAREGRPSLDFSLTGYETGYSGDPLRFEGGGHSLEFQSADPADELQIGFDDAIEPDQMIRELAERLCDAPNLSSELTAVRICGIEVMIPMEFADLATRLDSEADPLHAQGPDLAPKTATRIERVRSALLDHGKRLRAQRSEAIRRARGG